MGMLSKLAVNARYPMESLVSKLSSRGSVKMILLVIICLSSMVRCSFAGIYYSWAFNYGCKIGMSDTTLLSRYTKELTWLRKNWYVNNRLITGAHSRFVDLTVSEGHRDDMDRLINYVFGQFRILEVISCTGHTGSELDEYFKMDEFEKPLRLNEEFYFYTRTVDSNEPKCKLMNFHPNKPVWLLGGASELYNNCHDAGYLLFKFNELIYKKESIANACRHRRTIRTWRQSTQNQPWHIL